MATQTLEFNATTGLTISCKLFALESDTVVATVSATEKTNDKGRYSVAFTDVPAGAYRLNGFVAAVGGFANEIYDLTLETDTFIPRAEIGLGNVPSAEEIRTELDDNSTKLAAIVADTSELQTNQGNWLTATGFATQAGVESAAQSVIDHGDGVGGWGESGGSVASDAIISESPTIERVSGDQDAIRFSWPADAATITGQVSKSGGVFADVSGSISQRASEGDVYWYQLAYHANDRQLGSQRYKFTDGTYTRYVNLLVNPATAEVDLQPVLDAVGGIDPGGDATAENQQSILTAISSIGSGGDATAANQQSILSAIGSIDAGGGDATAANQQLILAAVGSSSGFSIPMTIRDDAQKAIGSCECTITATNTGSSNEVIRVGHTNDGGKVEFFLPPGTYYLWRHHRLYKFDDPVTFVVSATGAVTYP